MHDDAALLRLAEAAGIQPAYWDIRGRRHETTPETARALLAALAIPAATPGEIAQSLAGLDDEAWHELLPPVVVIHEGERGAAVPVHLGPAAVERRARMALHLEGGGTQDFDIDPTALAIAGRREIDGRRVEQRLLALPPLPLGYHRLEVRTSTAEASARLIVAPRRCYLPACVADGRKSWGVAAQLYALRTARNPGMGDFTDLAALAAFAHGEGAEAVGINPLHALFPATPAHASPYAPNSRQFLNPLYLDPAVMPGFADAAAQLPDAASAILASQASDRVDYAAISAIKQPIFEALHRHFCARRKSGAAGAPAQSFAGFADACGLALDRFALHAVLCEAFGTQDWNAWPDAYRDPASDACAGFARDHAERIGFHKFLQWQCAEQLGAAAAAARHLGMGIGIYGDLAVSSSPDGADVWGAQDVYAVHARVGAPPDPFNQAGQEWGVVPLHPLRLRKTGYAHFIALLRANMRHFGALRIDHAMELERLFWIPLGAPGSAGAYLRYPLDDLLAILALESVRNRCLVIGEDLGTVPEGFRERLAAMRILSYRVLYFENDAGAFKPPAAYPQLSAACVSTHDLPTLKGFWEETDLVDRLQAGVLTSQADYDEAKAERRAEKHALLAALDAAGLGAGPVDEDGPLTPELAAAIHRFVACADAGLFMVQIDDLTGEPAQTNMPGTTDRYPNWRRRIRVPLETLAQYPYARAVLAAVARERAPQN